MGTFLDGLKPWVAREVKLKQPRRLQEAMKMAEILEESYQATKHQGKEGVGEKSAMAPWKKKEVEEDTSKGKKGVEKLTKEEVQERIKKGLCFKCGGKWSKEHKCNTGQVLMIVDTCDESEGDGSKEDDEEDVSLSFHAMTGSKAPDTFCLMGWLGEQEVKVLVDTGSSHNFISSTVAMKAGLQGRTVGPLHVQVANDDKLLCQEVVRDVEVHVQGVPLTVDLYVLPLTHIDVVLGVAWLRSVGRVQTDYGRMVMKFVMKGKKQKWVAESWRSSLEDKGDFDGGGIDEDHATGVGRQASEADRTGEVDPG